MLRYWRSHLVGKFYIGLGIYFTNHTEDFAAATNHFQKTMFLATLTGNSKRQSEALFHLSWIKWQLGHYLTTQKYTYDSQRLARIAGDFPQEVRSLRVEAMC